MIYTAFQPEGKKYAPVSLEQELAVRRLVDRAAAVCGVSVTRLFKKDRDRDVIRAKHISMYLLYHEHNWSCTSIARLFLVDHTTVIYAKQTVADQLHPITGENEYKRAVRELMGKI